MQKDEKNSPSAQRSASSRRGSSSPSTSERLYLPKSVLLRGFQSYSRVLSEGRSFSYPPLRLFVRTNPQTEMSLRVGFAVSRSIRSATRRNRIKRLMREAYRLTQNSWTEPSESMEIVLLYTRVADTRPSLPKMVAALADLMPRALGRK